MSGRTRAVLAAWVATLAAACGGSEESRPTGASMDALPGAGAEESAAGSQAEDNRPPVVERVELEPASPRVGERVRARVDASDPDGDRFELVYRWFVGGLRADEQSPSLTVRSAERGDLVELVVVAKDGSLESEPVRVSARVGNQPPKILSVALEPVDGIVAGRDVVASPRAEDPDGDPLDFSFTWEVNGSALFGDDRVLPGEELERGDRVRLTVVAGDGTDESAPLRSQPITVGNAPPVFTSNPTGFDGEGVFRYTPVVEDADGDRRFRFSLKQGPPGMRIDPVAGELSWEPGAGQEGAHPVEIEADDFQGGSATQRFTLTVGFVDEAPAAPAP